MKFEVFNEENTDLTGLKQAAKVICKAKLIGTWKARNICKQLLMRCYL